MKHKVARREAARAIEIHSTNGAKSVQNDHSIFRSGTGAVFAFLLFDSGVPRSNYFQFIQLAEKKLSVESESGHFACFRVRLARLLFPQAA